MRPLPGASNGNCRLLYQGIHRITRHFNFDKEVGILVLETRPCPVGRRSGIAADAGREYPLSTFFHLRSKQTFHRESR